MFLKLMIISAAFIGASFILMSIRTLMKRDGRFPNTSVSGNKKLKELGITCAKCDEMARYRKLRKQRIKINPRELRVST